MERFVLNEALTTGVKMIDIHHKELIAAINDLADAIEEGKGANSVKKILTFLEFYAEWHFNHEEKCAHKNQCPLAEVNQNAHAIFLDHVKNYKLEYRQKDIDEDAIARKIHQELSQWLVNHIQGIDIKLGQQIMAAAQQARKNIEDARKAIKLGGNRQVLENNIENNQITYDAAMFYKQGLAHQKHQMMMANLECKKNILTAANTYKTAALSKDVAALIATSRRAFDSITSLAVPDLRPFDNLKMKEAFGRLTQDLRK